MNFSLNRVRWQVVSLSACLLASCTTLHQPVAYEPYFPLGPETEVSREAAEENAELKEDVEKLRAEIYESLQKARKSVSRVPQFDDPAIKARFSEIAKLWNHHELDAAWELSNKALQDSDLKSALSTPQWLRFVNLHFRLALEKHDLATAFADYEVMQKEDGCSESTMDASLLLGLEYFQRSKADEAYAFYEKTCLPEEAGPQTRMRRNYWLARFLEKNQPVEATRLYAALASTTVPSFYSVLAHQRLGKAWAANAELDIPVYRQAPIEVSNSVHHLWEKAERWLSEKKLMESQLALQRAYQSLEQEKSLDAVKALLYTAHLQNAAGASLDAMRSYSKAIDHMDPYPGLGSSFLKEMFPRPHSELVDSYMMRWQVDPDFAYAIIRQESAFNPVATSVSNARGWMQLMPFLADEIASQWGFKQYHQTNNLYYVSENLKLASYHLYRLGKLFPHAALIAAAYNAGTNRAMKWWKDYSGMPMDVFTELIPVNETKNYVKLVVRNYYVYKTLKLTNGSTLDAKLVQETLPECTATL